MTSGVVDINEKFDLFSEHCPSPARRPAGSVRLRPGGVPLHEDRPGLSEFGGPPHR